MAYCLLLTAYCLTRSAVAQAAVAQGGDKQLESGGPNQGGTTTESSSNRQQGTIGGAIATAQMSSSRFKIFPGVLGGTSAATTPLPVSELIIPSVSANTQPGGSAIAPSTWQRDRDPIFIWQPPLTGAEVMGYSFAFNQLPDGIIDTVGTSFDVATSSMKTLTDGKYTFAVAAVNSAGNSGPPATLAIWVDTAPPEVTASSPSPGSLLNVLSITVRATVADSASGVDQAAIQLLLNGIAISSQFNETTGILTATPDSWIEGVNRLSLRASDKVGNSQTPLVWSATVDTVPPAGTVSINGGASVTTSVYVTLSLAASDATTGVASMLISNNSLAGFVQEPYAPLRPLWQLNPVRGTQTVYVKFMDGAGNISAVALDVIDVALLSPETLITGGPAGFVPQTEAVFSFLCPEGNCVFSYAFDGDNWSDWSPSASVTKSQLSAGNHYFRVKAAKEANGIAGIQPDEEDPTPSERTWIVGLEPSIMAVPMGPPVKLWRIE